MQTSATEISQKSLVDIHPNLDAHSLSKEKLMSASLRRKRNELQKSLLELVDVCPFDQANPEDCPLFHLRKLKPRERAKWLDALPEADLRYLAAYHHVCYTARTKGPTAKKSAS